MTSEHTQRMKNLINGLIERTEGGGEGALKWDAVGSDTFELSLTRTTLRIESVDGDGNYPFVFGMFDENGRVVESIHRDGGNDTYSLDRLYACASRSHRGVDEKLTEVMEELGISDAPADDPWGNARKEPPF